MIYQKNKKNIKEIYQNIYHIKDVENNVIIT